MAERVLAERYRLDGVLGVGGVARVYLGTDLRLGRAVAVKVFRADSDDEQVRRFETEVRILAGLEHPALVPIHDSGVHDGHPFLVLRLVEGSTLRREIENGPLPLERVRALGARLATALAHVHGHGVVHRDVKPSNILLDGRGEAVLADFGLARLVDSPRLTSSDRMTGTAAYLAPEQVTGAEVGFPADVYALGLVLLECLTGTREYEGGGVETALARLHRPPRVPRDLPDELVRLLLLMTALPARRRPTAAKCAQLLAAAPPTDPVRPRRRWAPLVGASAVVVVAAICWASTADTTLRQPAAPAGPPIPTATPTTQPTDATWQPPTEQAPTTERPLTTDQEPAVEQPPTSDQATTTDQTTTADQATTAERPAVTPASAPPPLPDRADKPAKKPKHKDG
ncbi:serine/threonine-protein kinase [Actinokineospora diospyrosa]|uniref:non-specific serine/threonine protein kinase n=1 Tax=Actinokineospora diospyrosa TaxID=103728 RepID=A0ABT1IG05_9PSEU|nr:serine/threonine-protein kinase [Actinokineospora diospyrosa]MCP2271544.1 Serine/threonine protein kinase [Actinokineospora diospyrosa]